MCMYFFLFNFYLLFFLLYFLFFPCHVFTFCLIINAMPHLHLHSSRRLFHSRASPFFFLTVNRKLIQCKPQGRQRTTWPQQRPWPRQESGVTLWVTPPYLTWLTSGARKGFPALLEVAEAAGMEVVVVVEAWRVKRLSPSKGAIITIFPRFRERALKRKEANVAFFFLLISTGAKQEKKYMRGDFSSPCFISELTVWQRKTLRDDRCS